MRLINQKRFMLQIACLFLSSFLFISCSEDSSSLDEETGVEINEDIDSKGSLANQFTSQGWADSFAVNGKCYCKSTYDHHIGNVKVNGKTVRSICEKMKKDMKKALRQGGRKVWYNTVQCGHWPWHTDRTIQGQRDEVICPGVVGRRIKCNKRKGPKWDRKYLR